MNNKWLNRILVILLAVLFIGTSIIPSICGDYNNEQDTISLTFYTFDKTGTKECKVEISTIAANVISDTFEELKYKIINDPVSSDTKILKNDFVELLDSYDLIPQGLSKDSIVSLLNPRWQQHIENNNWYSKNNILSMQSPNIGSAVFCSVAGSGRGLIFTPIIFPRPRLFTLWSSFSSAFSTAANLYTGHGFAATGSQTGIALGFWGVGLSFAIPGEPAFFGFGGYALLALVSADDIEMYPPNQKPVISDENPSNDKRDVSVSLSELSFRISDVDGDRMSYWVTTDPDIGSGEAHLKDDGVYSVDVGNLEYDKSYSWTVRVSDGKDTVEKQFGFFTEMGPPFDPFNEGWQYRKKITIDHNMVAGDLSDFPVLVSLVDSDLADKAQFDGDDILFMDDDGVANRLFHEIEKYDSSGGELVCWVNIPNLSSSVDTVLYLYYGNLGCTSQQCPVRVWNSNYCGVWHLNKNPIDLIYDSTKNNNDGISHGLMDSENLIDGKIGKCIIFDGDDDYIAVADSPSLKPENVSLQTFFKPLENDPDGGFFLLKASYDVWGNADGRTYGFNWSDIKNYIGGRFERYASPQGEFLGSYPASLGSWTHLVLTFNKSSSSGAFYVNGIKYDSGNGYHDSVLWYNDPWDFLMGGSRGHEGSSKNINHWFKCCLDEVRVTSVSLDLDWISTEYNNLNNPSNFYSVGPED